MPSSQKLQIWLKPNCTECSLDDPLQTLLRFLFWYEIQNGGYGRTCLTLDPLGKMFQNASSLKPNCPGMIIGRSSVFYADRKSKMAATTGHSINTGPYRENTEISSSLKLLHWLNLNCASIIGRSFTNFVFFMLIVIPRWLPLQDIVFT